MWSQKHLEVYIYFQPTCPAAFQHRTSLLKAGNKKIDLCVTKMAPFVGRPTAIDCIDCVGVLTFILFLFYFI